MAGPAGNRPAPRLFADLKEIFRHGGSQEKNIVIAS
jgi:hypothetical protein